LLQKDSGRLRITTNATGPFHYLNEPGADLNIRGPVRHGVTTLYLPQPPSLRVAPRVRSTAMILPEHAVILLAEDLENDILLIRRALDQAGVNNPVHVVRDGEECLAYLHGFGKYANRDEFPLPDLLLLDLKMPKLDGFEVLREIRSNKSFAA